MEELTMMYDIQTEAIISAGLQLLREHLGIIETEIFISKVSRKGFDYTQWRENLYSQWGESSTDDKFPYRTNLEEVHEDKTLDELLTAAAEYAANHPDLIPKRVKRI
jgi:hypothetical protein